MSSQHHIIKRQLVEFQIPRKADGRGLQEEMAQIYKEDIVPMIDEYLSAYSSPDSVDRIDRLELDLGRLNPDNLRESFIEQVARQLSEKLPLLLNRETFSLEQPPLVTAGTTIPGVTETGKMPYSSEQAAFAGGNVRSTAGTNPEREYAISSTAASGKIAAQTEKPVKGKRESDLELLGFYLQNGSFPWWAKETGYAQFERSFTALLKTAPEKLQKLLIRFLPNVNALKRLVYTCDEQVLEQTVKAYLPARASAIAKLQAEWLKAPAAKKDKEKATLTWWMEVLPLVLTPQVQGTTVYPDVLIATLLDEIPAKASLDNYEQPLRLLKKIVAVFSLMELVKPVDKAIRVLKKAAIAAQDSGSAKSGTTGQKAAPDAKSKDKASGKSVRAASKTQALTADKTVLKAKHTLAELLYEIRLKTSGSPTATSPSGIQQADERLVLAELSDETFSESDTIEIRNAGLVILSPFLPTFFDRLGLLKEGRWTDEKAPEKACVLLNFLAMGTTEKLFEGDLPLIKILCGIPLEKPVNPVYKISKEHKAAAKGLLEAVIGYNPKMKNTSIAGFRGTFLLREGIVSTRDGSWLLRVEKKPFDVLLDSFAWNFRQIRHRWMEHLLHVEW